MRTGRTVSRKIAKGISNARSNMDHMYSPPSYAYKLVRKVQPIASHFRGVVIILTPLTFTLK